MRKNIVLTIGGIAVAAVFMCIGAGAAFFYLAKPMQKWNTEFSETYLPMQSDALQALRLGDQGPALLYLETVSAFSINELNKQNSEGAAVPSSLRTAKAVQYLCSNPPVIPGATTSTPSSIEEACSALTKPRSQ